VSLRRLAIATLVASAAFAAPAAAHGPDDPGQHGGPERRGTPKHERPAPPPPDATRESKRRAYGLYCQGQSKKHVRGMRGTPFSTCVRAMAKLDRGDTDKPRVACKGLSKRHVRGQRGTPYSRCVSAGERLMRDKADG